MFSRTYGWVQNPSDFDKLKLVVQIFDNKSTHYQNLRNRLIKYLIPFNNIKNTMLNKFNNNITEFSYTELVGTSKNASGKPAKKRSEAVADGLIQITILPQSYKTTGKEWTDNWTSDGYLRWGLSLGFIKHNYETDICEITDLGLEFSRTKGGSPEELKILQQSLLSYPPASQVLSILNYYNKPVTKFAIGNKLGFSGEKGFTSYDEKLMIDWLLSADKEMRKKIKSDIEGTSDKYARMIASWLEKVGYVAKHKNEIKTPNGTITGFQTYSITAQGLHALKQSNGSSKNTKIVKYLAWEFLAVDGKNRDYIRTRRAYILKILKNTKSINTLLNELKKIGFNDNFAIIRNDIDGLNNIGIRIKQSDKQLELLDNIVDFDIPKFKITKELSNKELEDKKIYFMTNTKIPVKYIELLEIAHDGKRNRDFEILTTELFNNIYNLNAKHLGGGRKPDAVVSADNFGIIIDTKAYEKGYSKNIRQADEMIRYIVDNSKRDKNRNPNEWWKVFPKTIPNKNYYFLWISSFFIGSFNDQILYTAKESGFNGGALNVEQLLLGAHKVISNELSINDLPSYMKNKEIIFSSENSVV